MRIADHEVGPGHPVFLAAELGVTACGSVERACALVDSVADAGAHAAKFIVTDPDKIMRRKDVMFEYETLEVAARISAQVMYHRRRVARPIYDLLKETTFTEDEWVRVRDYCHQRGIVFFATADHLDAVDMLEALEVPAHKLSAWDIAYLPLIRKMAATGKPVLVDVGTCTQGEMVDALDQIGDYQVMPVLSPHPIGAANWNMSRLRFWDKWPVGFSAPGREAWPDFVALGLGACLLEKRLTLRRDEPTGHHHAVSLEPDEFTAWVRDVRQAEAALREAPFAGTPDAWAERAKWDRDEEGYRR